MLRDCEHDILVYASGISEKIREQTVGPTLQYVTSPLDLRVAAQQCDAALLNGTHGATIAFLSVGKPSLHIPMYLEQRIIAALVKRLGAGGGVARNRPDTLAPALNQLLQDERAYSAAQSFAAKYKDFNPQAAAIGMADRIEEVL